MGVDRVSNRGMAVLSLQKREQQVLPAFALFVVTMGVIVLKHIFW